MGSISGKSSPGKGDKGGDRSGYRENVVEDEIISLLDGAGLDPHMKRNFDYQTVMHILEEVLPKAIEEENLQVAKSCEEVLAKYGFAHPNHFTGRWQPMSVPRNELQVRELFAGKLSDYGYRLIASHSEFPDWLLLDTANKFVYAEVEHRSSTFEYHGHNPKLCDLIVCWEHDWPEHSLPVLELFTGTTYETDRTPSPTSRASLTVNFSGSLFRHAYGKIRASQAARTDHIVNRYQVLRDEGKSDGEAIKLTALECGTTKVNVRGILNRREARQKKYSGGKSARVCGRVEALLLEGHNKSDAITKVSQEFRITRGTVHSYLSRNRHKAT